MWEKGKCELNSPSWWGVISTSIIWNSSLRKICLIFTVNLTKYSLKKSTQFSWKPSLIPISDYLAFSLQLPELETNCCEHCILYITQLVCN